MELEVLVMELDLLKIELIHATKMLVCGNYNHGHIFLFVIMDPEVRMSFFVKLFIISGRVSRLQSVIYAHSGLLYGAYLFTCQQSFSKTKPNCSG